jgi:hemolysin-activating ACP:hemolysin acyltransferase
MKSGNAGPTPSLVAARPERRKLALGMAVDHLMSKAVFGRMRFGELAQNLAGLINRDHYFFVLDSAQRIMGFAGWGETRPEHAERWIAGGSPPGFEECRSGECLVVNVWTADSAAVNSFMVRQMRKLHGDKTAVYFKRHYSNGRVRRVRIRKPK